MKSSARMQRLFDLYIQSLDPPSRHVPLLQQLFPTEHQFESLLKGVDVPS